jgi:hypothetical protein
MDYTIITRWEKNIKFYEDEMKNLSPESHEYKKCARYIRDINFMLIPVKKGCFVKNPSKKIN